jgi:hypothetical protein
MHDQKWRIDADTTTKNANRAVGHVPRLNPVFMVNPETLTSGGSKNGLRALSMQSLNSDKRDGDGLAIGG